MAISDKLYNPEWWLNEMATDLYFLCRSVLCTLEDPTPGYKDLYYPTHKKVCDLVLKNAKEGHKCLVLLPRHWIKSYVITVGWTIQRIIKNLMTGKREIILVDNATIGNAKEFLSKIKYNFQYNELLRGFMSHISKEVANQLKDLDNNADRWTQDEIQICGNRVELGSVEGNLVSRHQKVHIHDDLVNWENSRTTEQLTKVIDWWKLARSLLTHDGIEIIIGCLTGDSRVLMADGSEKEITNVKVGEEVMSFQKYPGFGEGLVPRVVDAMIPQGKAKVYEIKTMNRTVRATDNHPFLTTTRGYIEANKLNVGDKVKTAFFNDLGCSDITEEEAWAFGYMLGDGWLINGKKSRKGICIAKGVYENLNGRFKQFIIDRFGYSLKETKFGYYRADSKPIYEYFVKLGFDGNAHTKRIPYSMYGYSIKIKEALLRGIIDADGWIVKSGMKCMELCNRNLILDVKRLAESCGYKVSNVFKRTRLQKPPHSKKVLLATSYHISIGYKQKRKGVRWERIVSISYIGEEEVFDLTVEKTHNFVANGYIVHNTRWDFGDLYGHIIDKFLNPPKDYHIGKPIVILEKKKYHLIQMDCWSDPENEKGSTFPTLFPEWKLKELQNEQEDEFPGQYRNDPLAQGRQKFQRQWIRYYKEVDIPKIVNTVVLFDVADKDKKTSDWTGCTVADIGVDKKVYIREATRKKVSDIGLIDWIIELVCAYQPATIGVESTKFNTLQELIELVIPQKLRRREIAPGYIDVVQNIIPSLHELKHMGRPKETRIENMHGFVERGIVLFPRNMADDLIQELIRFGSTKIDDTADSFGYLYDVLIFPQKDDPEKTSIVSAEDKKTAEELEEEEWEKIREEVSIGSQPFSQDMIDSF